MTTIHTALRLAQISTGVPGLDDILYGGVPEYSFNVIAGTAGSGKTTLAEQIAFANASLERKVLYLTVLGESPLKLLHYARQMSFFRPELVGEALRFFDLSQDALKGDLGSMLDKIVTEVTKVEPAILVLDSFRTLVRSHDRQSKGQMGLREFLHRLALHLTSWQTTSFFLGEYGESDIAEDPIFTAADGVFWLGQSLERRSVVRTLRVLKLRGQPSMPGLHTTRIDGDGLHVFPRILSRPQLAAAVPLGERLPSGIPALDPLVGGGLPRGDTTLVAGPSGTGKTCFGMHFATGVPDEGAVVLLFEEKPEDYLRRDLAVQLDLGRRIRERKLALVSIRPLDLSVDETLLEVQRAAAEVNATRLVIDSLTGFEVALAPTFREDFRESLYRMLNAMTGAGMSIMMTIEASEIFHELRFTPHAVSFLTDNIIALRYVELGGHLRKMMAVVKMRRSGHSTAFHEFAIGREGVIVKAPLAQYRGLLTVEPKVVQLERFVRPGLTEAEEVVLEHLFRAREATAESIGAALGLKGAVLARALGRLTDLDYAIRVKLEGKTVFRPLARALGEE
jgi:circadian clock protein KaiC